MVGWFVCFGRVRLFFGKEAACIQKKNKPNNFSGKLLWVGAKKWGSAKGVQNGLSLSVYFIWGEVDIDHPGGTCFAFSLSELKHSTVFKMIQRGSSVVRFQEVSCSQQRATELLLDEL